MFCNSSWTLNYSYTVRFSEAIRMSEAGLLKLRNPHMLLLSLILCCNHCVGVVVDCIVAVYSLVLLLMQICHTERHGGGVKEWILTFMMFMAQLRQC